MWLTTLMPFSGKNIWYFDLSLNKKILDEVVKQFLSHKCGFNIKKWG